MTHLGRASAATRRPRTDRGPVAVSLVVVAAVVAVSAYQVLPWSSSTAARGAIPTVPPVGPPRNEGRVALGVADGAVPDGTTAFADAVPGVANLRPVLLGALRRAATDAARDRVELVVDSGWRSPEYQEQLLREAVAKYGSRAAAARWVATPETSAHVSGDAVDVGPDDARAWLQAHGAAYGLCRIYRNEPWHFELRPEAVDQGCPAMYADAAHDPRMQP